LWQQTRTSLLSVTEIFVREKNIKPISPCSKKNTAAKIKKHMETKHKGCAFRHSSSHSALTFREGIVD
jgi:hypothetical protein